MAVQRIRYCEPCAFDENSGTNEVTVSHKDEPHVTAWAGQYLPGVGHLLVTTAVRTKIDH